MEVSHLFLGTKLDNTQDMIAKGRKADQSGERHGNATLTEAKVQVMRFLSRHTSLRQIEIADLLSVHRVTANKVVKGRAWTHVPEIAAVAA